MARHVNNKVTIVAFEFFIFSLATNTFLSIYAQNLVDLGCSMTTINLLTSLFLGRGLITGLILLNFGFLVSILGRRLILILSSTSLCLLTLGFLLINVRYSPTILVLAFTFYPLGMLLGTSLKSLVAHLSSESSYGGTYGKLMSSYFIAAALSEVGIGYIADRLGYLYVYVILASLTFMLITLSVIVGGTVKSLARSPRGESRVSLKDVFSIPKSLRVYYVIISIDSIAWGFTFVLGGILRNKPFSFTNTQITIIFSTAMILAGIFSGYMGKICDKVGEFKFMLIAESIGVICQLIILSTCNFYAILIESALFGISISFWFPAIYSYVSKAASNVDFEMGRLDSLRCFTMAPSIALGGLLYDNLGYKVPYYCSIAMLLLNILVILSYMTSEKSKLVIGKSSTLR